ncbi:isoaspartyl peptidase/L-asparaginase [Larkinella sp. VNQ87]|uniref:isoaspartyl peptidase/L-asparaginase n=1 Tax=Larkinella sp. VNQ87 TaxID=3400921 RepID=UPI003C06F656
MYTIAIHGGSGTINRTVMEQSENVFLLGTGAEVFAREHQLPFEPDDYFSTEHQFQQVKEAQAENRTRLDHSRKNTGRGTVGAVALDSRGNLASATSTGGLTNMQYGLCPLRRWSRRSPVVRPGSVRAGVGKGRIIKNVINCCSRSNFITINLCQRVGQ